MQNVSALYKEIIGSPNHWFEVALAIGESGRLIDEQGDTLLFGDTSILVDTGGAETAFRETALMSVATSHSVFNENYPTVGSAVSGEIDVKMLAPAGKIPRKARLVPYTRVVNATQASEWIQKGVYYIDTRATSNNSNGLNILTFHGYDAMLMFEQDYPSDSTNNYPMLDTDMVAFIASHIKMLGSSDMFSIPVDPRTWERMDKGYTFSLPIGYSSREVLGIIAAAYGGNFVMSDQGALLLIRLCDLPKETNHLIDNISGDPISFGIAPNEVLILV